MISIFDDVTLECALRGQRNTKASLFVIMSAVITPRRIPRKARKHNYAATKKNVDILDNKVTIPDIEEVWFSVSIV